jgi:hypothetical protein
MATLGIEFEWTRASAKTGEYKCEGGQIRQITAGREWYSPLVEQSALYLVFANLDGSPGACRSFAQNCGLLFTEAKAGASESLNDWKRQIQLMKNRLMLVEAGRFLPRPGVGALMRMTTVTISLECQWPDRRWRLLQRPETLLDAMVIQFAQAKASEGVSVQRCKQCGNWFERGGGRGGKARRSISTFCSERCKNRHHYEQQRASK